MNKHLTVLIAFLFIFVSCMAQKNVAPKPLFDEVTCSRDEAVKINLKAGK